MSTTLNSKLQIKIAQIKILFTDVDGVLTDGGLYYTDSGLTFKKFNVKDGMAVKLLQDSNVKCGIISTDTSAIITTRAERLKMDFSIIGQWDKLSSAKNICEKFNFSLQEAAFIGDDVNDVELLKEVGFSVCPADAIQQVKELVDYISPTNGGCGVFREIADLIIANK